MIVTKTILWHSLVQMESIPWELGRITSIALVGKMSGGYLPIKEFEFQLMPGFIRKMQRPPTTLISSLQKPAITRNDGVRRPLGQS